MSHPNDHAEELLEWELPEQAHLRSKFGYWHMVEMRKHRADVKAAGIDPDSPEGHSEVLKRRTQFHAQDETFKETQKRLYTKWVDESRAHFEEGTYERRMGLNKEEVDYLVFRLTGVNDPVGLCILEKLVELGQ